jgi:hypothetical protein
MNLSFLKDRFWILGIACAVVGSVLFKVVARLFTQPIVYLGFYIAGITLALGGLVIIMFGISKKYKYPIS